MKLEKKVLTRDGVIELVGDKYITFTVHNHIRSPHYDSIDEVIDVYASFTKGKKLPLVIEANKLDHFGDKEEERIRAYSNRFFSAKAIVSDNTFTTAIYKLMHQIKGTRIPTKIFKSKEQALVWIDNYI